MPGIANKPIESGVTVYQPKVSTEYRDGSNQPFTIWIRCAKTTSVIREGNRMLDTGYGLVFSGEDWFESEEEAAEEAKKQIQERVSRIEESLLSDVQTTVIPVTKKARKK